MYHAPHTHTLLLVFQALVVAVVAPAVLADVTFFFQREGCAEDTGLAVFTDVAGLYRVQDFDDPALGPDGAEMPVLPVGDFQLGLRSMFADGSPFIPIIGYSPEFNVQGKVYNVALVVGSTLTIGPAADQPIVAAGAWIFDDGRALDSAYALEVTEPDGRVYRAILENKIPLDSRGHEIEGFIGAVSTVGIAEWTLIAVNPVSGEMHADSFEIDYLMIAPPRDPPVTDPPPPDAGLGYDDPVGGDEPPGGEDPAADNGTDDDAPGEPEADPSGDVNPQPQPRRWGHSHPLPPWDRRHQPAGHRGHGRWGDALPVDSPAGHGRGVREGPAWANALGDRCSGMNRPCAPDRRPPADRPQCRPKGGEKGPAR